jgi:hypothetical protein
MKPCTFQGCTNQIHAKGLCGKHLKRLYRNGSPSIALPTARKGSDNGRWNGGVITNRNRVFVYSPQHPRPERGNYVRRARLVIEKSLGRFLTSDEVVHHINGDSMDDRRENLIVLSQSDHAYLHCSQKPKRLCTKDGCGEKHHCHGLCKKHYWAYEYATRAARAGLIVRTAETYQREHGHGTVSLKWRSA